jgi:uncharacterized membrane-anchored protein YjiN (DUF445 family)
VNDADRLIGLRRMKVVATSLLVAAAIVYVVARTSEDRAPWVGYVRATAEAAMVGALADWFAVTALFRHPLGIPIPHTAIIPERKDQIGRSLGEFVQGNFLSADVLGGRLTDIDVAGTLGRWLSRPANAARGADVVADAFKGAVEVLDDRDVQGALEHLVEHRVRATPLAPLVGRAIEIAIDGGHHHALLDSVLTGLRTFLIDNRASLRARLEQESPWWIPEPIDDRIFNKIFEGVQSFLHDVGVDSDHDVRRGIDERLLALVERLQTDPELVAKGEELKREVLDHPEIRRWLNSLWGELKGALLEGASDPDGELRRRLASALQRLGERLTTDSSLRARVDDWVQRAVVHLASHYRDEVSDLIATTVEQWDADTTSRRLELQVGRDLQFIRINGTVVGGLAGLAIYTVGQFL